MCNRVTFIIDGFNLYHSIRDIEQDRSGLCLKWLDVKSLCSSSLYIVDRSAVLESIYYFTAFAKHLRDPQVIARHQTYLKCLEDTGIMVERGRFKPRDITCKRCNQKFTRYEEKETDVAIASKLFEVFHDNSCDTAVLVTGDTDQTPAIRTVIRLFPDKDVVFAFPYRRFNQELKNIAPNSFKIRVSRYSQYQFPDPYIMQDGMQVPKPSTW